MARPQFEYKGSGLQSWRVAENTGSVLRSDNIRRHVVFTISAGVIKQQIYNPKHLIYPFKLKPSDSGT
jgi:hypothetical protein